MAQGSKMKNGSDTIRVVVFKDGPLWIAQCLEYDIGAQANDLDTLRDRLELALEVEARTGMEIHGEPFAGIDPAPDHFHEMWGKRSREFNAKLSVRKDGASVPVDLALCA